MMRKIYVIGTLLFLLALLALYLLARQPEARAVHVWYTLDQVAAHNRAADCWMAIHDRVYDLTDYVREHPAPPIVLLSWCGKEASHAFDTKGRNRPHSEQARQLLQRYYKGQLQTE